MKPSRFIARLTLLAPGALAGFLLVCACDNGADSGPKTGGQVQGLAVVNSDYVSTSISLLDGTTGLVTQDNCITSGKIAPKLSLALSGDVVLPSQRQHSGELTVIDRKNGTLTWIEPKTCTVARQLSLGTAFATNPHDIISVSATKAYVLRNGTGGADGDIGMVGSDILVVDPSLPQIGRTIDLRPSTPMAEGGKATLPGPQRGVLATNGKVYVTLSNLSADFKIAGPARVVVIDTATDTVTNTIDLPGLQNCGGISYAAGVNGLAVSCGGLFGDGPMQVNSSGVAWIDLTKTPATVTVLPGTTFGRPLALGGIAALGAPLAYAITPGDFAGPPGDQLWTFAFQGVKPALALETMEAFTLGGLVVNAVGTRLFVTDAAKAAPKLYVFNITNPQMLTETQVVTNPGGGLPPREIAWY